jgi:hypothetical protein
MAKKPTVLSDADIVTRVNAKAQESVGWYNSKLSRERERVTRYYNGTLPKRQHEGSSSYVSTDVYDAVEQAKAMNLEVFAGGEHIATFDADQDMNADACRVATDYASYVIFRQNDGFKLFDSVMHDGFTARAGIAKIYYEKKDAYSDETFSSLSHDDAYAEASKDDVHEFDGTHDPATNTYSGTLTRKKDASKICIDAIAPEEFGIAPRSCSLDETYCHHRTLKTRAELLKEGYDPKKVAKVPNGDETGVLDTPEVIARNEPVENGQFNAPVDDASEQIEVFESYVRMQIDSSKGVRLYKVVHAHNVLLEEPEEVDKAPFLAYVPLPVPHTFYGNNFAARVIPTQNARTVLVRGVLDHTAITTNPRWAVVSGGLLNPREMLENRLGGLVNVRRPDSIAPLPQNNLNPFVFEVLKQLSADKEESTGISALSKGLNKDAISSQNSQGLLDNMMQAGGQRQKIAARHFATSFFVPLMIEVIRLAVVNQAPSEVLEVAGQPLQVDPKLWTERKTCTVSMHLGYGEKDQAVAKMTKAYEMLAKDPALATMFSPQNRYALIRDTMKLSGLNNAAAYITSPDKAPPPQPDQMKVQELQIKDKLADAAVANSQANNMKVQKTLVIDSQRMDNERHKMQMDAQDLDRTHNRQDLETAARIDTAREELKLQEKEIENAAAQASVQASLSPRP